MKSEDSSRIKSKQLSWFDLSSARNPQSIGGSFIDNATPVRNDLGTTVKSDWANGAEDLLAGDGVQAVSHEELIKWLSARLQTYPHCDKVTVERLAKLERPDTDGCNWSRSLVLNPAGTSAIHYGIAYASVLREARRRFNLS